MNTQYFQGILQLRNHTEEVLEFIDFLLSKREDVLITKEEKQKRGVDLYFTSQKFMQNLGRKLQQKFGGELIFSKRLHTTNRQTSKLVYRVNVLFRMAKFKKGDVIEVGGVNVKVISIRNKVYGKEIKSGKKIQLEYKNLPKSLF